MQKLENLVRSPVDFDRRIFQTRNCTAKPRWARLQELRLVRVTKRRPRGLPRIEIVENRTTSHIIDLSYDEKAFVTTLPSSQLISPSINWPGSDCSCSTEPPLAEQFPPEPNSNYVVPSCASGSASCGNNSLSVGPGPPKSTSPLPPGHAPRFWIESKPRQEGKGIGRKERKKERELGHGGQDGPMDITKVRRLTRSPPHQQRRPLHRRRLCDPSRD